MILKRAQEECDKKAGIMKRKECQPRRVMLVEKYLKKKKKDSRNLIV